MITPVRHGKIQVLDCTTGLIFLVFDYIFTIQRTGLCCLFPQLMPIWYILHQSTQAIAECLFQS